NRDGHTAASYCRIPRGRRFNFRKMPFLRKIWVVRNCIWGKEIIWFRKLEIRIVFKRFEHDCMAIFSNVDNSYTDLPDRIRLRGPVRRKQSSHRRLAHMRLCFHQDLPRHKVIFLLPAGCHHATTEQRCPNGENLCQVLTCLESSSPNSTITFSHIPV